MSALVETVELKNAVEQVEKDENKNKKDTDTEIVNGDNDEVQSLQLNFHGTWVIVFLYAG